MAFDIKNLVKAIAKEVKQTTKRKPVKGLCPCGDCVAIRLLLENMFKSRGVKNGG